MPLESVRSLDSDARDLFAVTEKAVLRSSPVAAPRRGAGPSSEGQGGYAEAREEGGRESRGEVYGRSPLYRYFEIWYLSEARKRYLESFWSSVTR